MKRGFAPKATLTPEERLRAAYANDILGVDQHTISALFGVNQGRVAEAIEAVRAAVGAERSRAKVIRGARKLAKGHGGASFGMAGGNGGTGGGARA